MQDHAAPELDLRAAASNPNTAPDRLVDLAATGDRDLHQLVAANPNTPPQLLWQLGAEFPDVVSANPILLLLAIAGPNLAKEIPLATLRQLVRCEQLPTILLAESARRGDFFIEQALTANPQTPVAILKDLSQHPTFAVQEAAKLHITLAGELPDRHVWQERACEATIARLRQGRTGMLAQPHAPILLLHWLAASDAPLLRETAAKNPIAPPEILTQLACDPVVQVRQATASNPATPPATLARLGREDRWGLRSALAGNPQTPATGLVKLAREAIAAICTHITHASRLSSGTLLENSWQPQWQLLRAIAQNPGASHSLLEGILTDLESRLPPSQSIGFQAFGQQYDRLRRRMAGHPQIPAEQAMQLFGPGLYSCLSAGGWQSSFAGFNPNELPFYILREIADNPRTPPAILTHLSGGGVLLRRAVAQNPALKPEFCDRLARDRDTQVRLNLTTNSATPTAALVALLADAAPAVRTAAIAPYLKRIPADLPRILTNAMDTAASDRRFIWLFHPQMPATRLVAYADSLNWLERCAIAQNPNTPISCLQQLARDGNQVVRGAARATLPSQRNEIGTQSGR